MNLLIKSLINILEEIITHHNKLHALLKREKEVMINNSLEDLEKCTKEKETITLKLKILEESRMKIVTKLSNFLNINKKDITITKLSEISGDKYSKKLKEAGARLNAVIAEINILNNENRVFIKCFMDHIKLAFSFLNQVNAGEFTYQNNGEPEETKVTGRVLCKV